MSPVSDLPLGGVRVLQLGGIGPVPHAGLVLAMLGATGIRIERPGTSSESLKEDTMLRGLEIRRIDLKSSEGRDRILELAATCDVVLEGFRPGVAERLGLGPDDVRSLRPRVIYGRMTGWGQDGPLAPTAGHDINYIALTGALDAIGVDHPTPPLNLVGDFGGGSMFLVAGVLAALLRRERVGVGDVVDAAIVDGTSVLMQMIWSLRGQGRWVDERHSNVLDGGAPFYRTYECADGRYVAVGAIEPQFFANLIRVLGLPSSWLSRQREREGWPELTALIADRFAAQGRDEWVAAFVEHEACVSPVLSLEEAPHHPQVVSRGLLTGSPPAPAATPRFASSRPVQLPPATVHDEG